MDFLPRDVAVAAQSIWDYMNVGHSVDEVKVDVILCLGSNDTRVAERAADLYKSGVSPLVVFSGCVGELTRGLFGGLSEAEAFARVAETQGVPRSAMLIEDRSTNTGENARFSSELLLASGRQVKEVLVLTKPFMERRALATFLVQWPRREGDSPHFLISSPQIPLSLYPDADDARGLSLSSILSVMAGDMQRVAIYPPRGFQAYMAIPPATWEALQVLITKGGFTRHLIKAAARSRTSVAGEEATSVGGDRDLSLYEGLDAASPPPYPSSSFPKVAIASNSSTSS
jgi:hypothetical protein